MSKLLQSLSRSSSRYSRTLDASVSRLTRRKGYGRLGSLGSYETNTAPSTPSFAVRVPRKLRIVRLGSRHSQGKKPQRLGESEYPTEEPSSTILTRLRDAYEKMMTRAAAKTGEMSVIPAAKTTVAPPTLALAFGSRRGSKVREIDPGFKMTAVEKKYLQHLKRTASSGRF